MLSPACRAQRNPTLGRVYVYRFKDQLSLKTSVDSGSWGQATTQP